MKYSRTVHTLVYLVLMLFLFNVFSNFGMNRVDLTYSEILELFEEEKVKSFTVQDNIIELELHKMYNGEYIIHCNMADAAAFRAEIAPLLAEQTESGVLESYDFQAQERIKPMDFVMPLLIAGGLLLMMWFILMGKANGNNPLNLYEIIDGKNVGTTFSAKI